MMGVVMELGCGMKNRKMRGEMQKIIFFEIF